MPQIGSHALLHGFGFGGFIPLTSGGDAVPFPLTLSEAHADRYWMGQALLKAMEASGRSSPNPSVGAVICKDNRLLASGATEVYGGRHAEKVALDASSDPRGATCYVTLEPCAHQGKQPPCAEAIIAAGIKRCVIGSFDPHPKASGVGIKRLREAGIEVVEACLAAECIAWHFPFLAYQAVNRPVIIGKWAQTLDGHLADDWGESQWISGPPARAYTHWLRQRYDAIMIGATTALRDAPKLNARDSALSLKRQPHKIVLDPSGRLAQAPENVVQALGEGLDRDGPLLFWCSSVISDPAQTALGALGERLVFVPIPKAGELDAIIDHIAAQYRLHCQRELQSIMVEGGAQLLTSLMRADLLDALHVFVRAGVLGGTHNRIGRIGAEDRGLPLMQRHDFHLLSSFQLGDDLVLECANRRFPYWDQASP